MTHRFREQARSHRGRVPTHQIPDKKKPDLAKAFNRATHSGATSAKGGRCAYRLEGLRQITRPTSDYLAINGSGDLGKLGVGLVQALLLEVAAQVHAFGVNEGHVVDTDESHDLTQVRFLVIRRAASVDPAASS